MIRYIIFLRQVLFHLSWVWLLLGVLSSPLQAQINGSAFLQGETNHQGIQVSFDPISLTGMADTAYTDPSGAYSLNLLPGVYQIEFSRPGFNSILYDNGIGQILGGTETLLPQTLSDLTFKYISGGISDTLYADTIYLVAGDLTVAANNHLYLQAGTHLLFDGNYQLTCYGNFDAVGTPNAPVTISSNQANPQESDWKRIEIRGGTDTLRLEHCQVSYGKENIWIENVPYVQAYYNRFQFAFMGLAIRGNTSATISENEWSEVSNTCLYLNTGSGTEIEVSCNYFHDANAIGLYTYESRADLDIHNNSFVGMQGQYGGAVSLVVNEGSTLVEENVMVNSTSGFMLLIVDSTQSSVLLQHNFIANNTSGIILRGADGGSVIQMNALIDNLTYGIIQPYPPAGTPDLVAYNLVTGSPSLYETVNIVGLGSILTTNANGTPCDAYLNISASPGFDASQGVLPPLGSPLLDAGDPAAPLDPDGSVADIGLHADMLCPTPYLGYSSKVYPGDLDHNQLANVWDLLALGQFYGTPGPVRPAASLNWVGQTAADWGITQPNGADIKHIDSNGDGFLDAQDTTAILLNYLSVHNGNRSFAQPGGVPLYFAMPNQGNAGDTIIIPIHLGTVDTPAVGMYGMAVAITYDTSMVATGSAHLSFQNSWVGGLGTEFISLQKDLFQDGKIDFAITRITQTDQNGYGEIARLIIVLDEDISKTLLPFQLDFADVRGQNHLGETMPIGPEAGVLMVESTPTSVTSELQAAVSLFPNPASQQVQLQSSGDLQLQSATLFQADGRRIGRYLATASQHLSLSVADLPPGLYLLRVQTNQGAILKKLQVQQ